MKKKLQFNFESENFDIAQFIKFYYTCSRLDGQNQEH